MIPNHLRYFIEIADTKSFTKAAENLFVSQSTLSKAVAALETELQTTLYIHGNRRFTLTQSGELLYSFAMDVLGYYEDQEKLLLSRLEKSDNKLTLGLPPTAGSIYFYSLINDYRQRYPDIQLSIVDSTSRYIPDLLLSGDLDLGIVIEPFSDERFVREVVFRSEAVLVVSDQSPLAGQKTVDFFSLKEERFLQVTEDYQFYSVFQKYCEKAGFVPKVTFTSNQWDMILEMAGDNQGVTIFPLPLVENHLPRRADYLHLTNPEFPWSLTVIYPREELVTRPMQRFLELLD